MIKNRYFRRVYCSSADFYDVIYQTIHGPANAPPPPPPPVET